MAAVPPGGQPSGPAAARRELTGPSWALEQRRGGQLPRISRDGSIGLSHGGESWETWDQGHTWRHGWCPTTPEGDRPPKTLRVSVHVCRGEGVCCPRWRSLKLAANPSVLSR